jgi:uncharacterized protein YfaP (DUF2135 family)
MTAKLTILAPTDGAVLSSPLAIVRLHYDNAKERTATIRVGEVVHIVELAGESGEIRENVTLLEGHNEIKATIGHVHKHIGVEVERSKSIGMTVPAADEPISERATTLHGSYKDTSCPAGVIAVNGFMQQFAVRGSEGIFDEKIVLRAGANHVAVQIGELYTTRLVTGAFDPAKLLVTLVWDTPSTDVDLYVYEPEGGVVYYSSKQHAGNLDVDRTQGFGPENYSIGKAGKKVAAGDYRVRVHYYADRGLGRTEWTIRVISDESTTQQQQSHFYGILDFSASSNASPGGEGRDWNEVCTIHVAADGDVRIREG